MLVQENKKAPRNLTYRQVYNSALEMFDNDKDKTNSWWMSPQEEFENLSPYEMVKTGKGRKLMRLINKCKG